MKSILKQVIKDIQPPKEYEKEILQKAHAIIRKINTSLKDVKAVLGGSGAKGTSLKTFDADIFVKFSYEKYFDKSEDLPDILEKPLKKNFKVVRLHGSRDYFQIREDPYTFEIIPILDIRKASEAKNITDVSPLHSSFVLKHKKLANEMRLTKQFFKAANVYGAESHIRGFSGYVCEVLTVHYGSFEKLVKAVPLWKDKTIIDLSNFYKGKNVLMELNRSKLQSPLIVVDPVQHDRNAAAALEPEKFSIIKDRARAFLKRPSASFFEIKKPGIEELRRNFENKPLFILRAEPLDKKEDIAGAKLRKSFHFIEAQLTQNDFKIEESEMLWNPKEALLYFVLKKDALPKENEILGPMTFMKSHVAAFRKKYKNAKIRNDRYVASTARKYPNALSFFQEIIKAENVRANVQSIVIL